MKKFILFSAAAILFSGVAFAAYEKGKKKKCAKGKSCCSKSKEACKKKDNKTVAL